METTGPGVRVDACPVCGRIAEIRRWHALIQDEACAACWHTYLVCEGWDSTRPVWKVERVVRSADGDGARIGDEKRRKESRDEVGRV